MEDSGSLWGKRGSGDKMPPGSSFFLDPRCSGLTPNSEFREVMIVVLPRTVLPWPNFPFPSGCRPSSAAEAPYISTTGLVSC